MTLLDDTNNENATTALNSSTLEGSSDLPLPTTTTTTTSPTTTTTERTGGGVVLLTEEQLLSMTNDVSDEEEEEEEDPVSAAKAAGRDIVQKQQQQQQHSGHQHLSSSKNKKEQEAQGDAISTTSTLLSTKKGNGKSRKSMADDPSTTTMAVAGSHASTTTTVPSPPPDLLEATQGGYYVAPGAHRVQVNNNAGASNTPTDAATITPQENEEEAPPITIMATLVTPATETPAEDVEARVRQQVLSEAVVAQQVVALPGDMNTDDDSSSTDPLKKNEASTPQTSSCRRWILLLVALIVISAAAAVGVVLSSQEKDTPGPTGLNTETSTFDIGEDGNEDDNEDDNGDDNEDDNEDGNDNGPPDWWIDVSPDVVLPNSPQRRAYEWMTANAIYGEQSFGGPKEAHMYAMVTFYYATGGDSSWLRNDGWLDPDTDLCDWYPGTMCTDMPAGGPPSRLRHLQKVGGAKLFSNLRLPNNGLIGTLPPELWLIGSLQTLDLSGNQLTGGSGDDGGPLSILFQSNLREVRLEGNDITGTVPEAICTPFTNVALPQGGVLAMDCLDTTTIECSCCTICCLDGADCQPQ